jgi:hypothetical protein
MKTKLLRFGLCFTLVTLLAGVASAQVFVEYSAKFACGIAGTATPMVQPGTYSTTINIHNPHNSLFSIQTSTMFLKYAVESLPEGVTPLPPSAPMTDVLPNNFSEEVDCTIIKKLLGITGTTFIEGWVVLVVPPTPTSTGGFFTNELDVVGIYTDSKGAEHTQPATEKLFGPGAS